MNKHIFLIIAHNEPLVLAKLVELLDDDRNDILIHWDRKSGEHPRLHTKYASLYWTKQRVDVRWGDVSQIESELVLLEEASFLGSYDFYHILSGTHLPLISQDEMHQFYGQHLGQQLFQRIPNSAFQTDLKMQRYHFFTRHLQIGSLNRRLFYQRLWRVLIALQRALHIRRRRQEPFKHAANWVSVTQTAVDLLLKRKGRILSDYRYTLCGDEFFIPTVLNQSAIAASVVYTDRLVMQEMGNANARTLEMKDYEALLRSGCLFGRKFSEQHLGVVDRIVEHIKGKA